MRCSSLIALSGVALLARAQGNATDATGQLVAAVLQAVSSGSGSLFSNLAYTLLPSLPECGRTCLDALVIPSGVFSCFLGAAASSAAPAAPSSTSAGFHSDVLACVCRQHDLQLNLYRCATDSKLCGNEPDRNKGVEALVSLCGSQGVAVQTAQLAQDRAAPRSRCR